MCKVQQGSEPQCSPLCSAPSPAPHSKAWLPSCKPVPALLPHAVPPIIAAGPLELVVLEGLEVLLPCAARGVPEPRVSWSREGALLQGGKATVLPSGELLLRDVQVSAVPWGRCEVGVLRNTCLLLLKSLWVVVNISVRVRALCSPCHRLEGWGSVRLLMWAGKIGSVQTVTFRCTRTSRAVAQRARAAAGAQTQDD